MAASGEMVETALPPWPPSSSSSSSSHEVDGAAAKDEEDENLFRRVFPGGIAVQAPLFIPLLAAEEADLRTVTVRISASNPNPDDPSRPDASRDRATVVFEVPEEYLLDNDSGRLTSLPPRLLDFYVDHLTIS